MKEDEESFLYNFGYTVPVRRNPDGSDPLQSIFKSIIELPIDVDGLHQLEKSKKSKEDEIKDINRSINDTWKEIGGIDGNELGRDGEIWKIADKCFDITAGKYTYEVCLFGKALQKESSDKGGGTNLGQWTGIEYENDDNGDASIRVMKWENGAKCWNGPKRSATVYMKCGIEHRIISANEPDTCRYVFEMESYLACDDSYKLRAGLL
ncbi:mannose 6-phosphate receptor domain-containing protein [Fragilariopsis cylindrus CCMP1102]|uniref:Mannose 6-phosphate receptor domain-containing protein n=1 Tax=Fragilariopsis cylindrus CCMP1102 TaxID=635003 RepID=A0A1E7ETL6_9STRA|nr:mannose 6-phosphate receptor domain-containing protein [Fragilariopsis cylindrus CCMP1102]|eukprot:OEU09175.1 mannose 6-phosphate receptor domain-containing protein [Fragilariopsis cylindrus CCMP1102]